MEVMGRLDDKITVQGTVSPIDLEFTLRGFYMGLDETAFFFHHAYLDKALGRPGRVGPF